MIGVCGRHQSRPLLKVTLMKHQHLTFQMSMRFTCENRRSDPDEPAYSIQVDRCPSIHPGRKAKLPGVISDIRSCDLNGLSIAAVSAGSRALGCAEISILGNAGNHELPIRPTSTITRDRIEPVDAGLREEGTDRLSEPMKPSPWAPAILPALLHASMPRAMRTESKPESRRARI